MDGLCLCIRAIRRCLTALETIGLVEENPVTRSLSCETKIDANIAMAMRLAYPFIDIVAIDSNRGNCNIYCHLVRSRARWKDKVSEVCCR